MLLQFRGSEVALTMGFLEDLIEEVEAEIDLERCPGCNRGPGEGYGEECFDEDGCGLWKCQDRLIA